MKEHIIVLNNGRKIGFSEYGNSDNTPILYFHGFPGSRLEATAFEKNIYQLDCRLISIDRPGMGNSDYDQNGTIKSWAADIDELTEKLGINEFVIIAHSGGTPFAVACAEELKSKVKAMALVSGIAPCQSNKYKTKTPYSRRIMSLLLKYTPGLASLMMKLTKSLLKNPIKMKKQLKKRLPQVDVKVFEDEDNLTNTINAVSEAFKQGSKKPAHEMKLIFKDWEVNLNNISCHVEIWHGTLDKQVPLSDAYFFHSFIKNSNLTVLDNQGHHSLIRNYFIDIINSILFKRLNPK